MKKLIAAVLLVALLVSCGGGGQESNGKPADDNGGSEPAKEITVVSREDGSGTRGAFTEITGVLTKKDGVETDNTYEGAVIQNSTNGVITTVQGDESSIGYISLGSLNDSVKALKVEGVEATAAEVKAGNYPLARPFLLVHQDDLSEIAQDFLAFVLSEEGQEIVEDMGYISVNDPEPYDVTRQSGRVALSGSTSVTPLMEKLADAYKAHYDDVTIEIQATGSSAGITAAMEGASDLGMSSRELKAEEESLNRVVLAQDGIAVIVNKANAQESLTMEEIRQVFTGEKRSF